MAKGKKYKDIYLVNPEKDKNGPWKWVINEKVNGILIREEKRRGPDGKRFEHAKDAWDDRCRRMEELIHGNGGYKNINKITFEYVYNDFTNSPKAQERANSTLRKHSSVWRNHVAPVFKDRKINSTTVNDMYCFLLEKYNSGDYAYGYIESFVKLFYLLYGHALSKQWIPFDKYNEMFKNETSRLKMPDRRREDPEDNTIITYSDVELYQIEKVFARDKHIDLYPSYMLARYAGLRKGEIFGLRWSDINWRERTINIRCQMQRDEEKKIYILTPPKTKNAIRYILIPDILYTYLFNLKKQRDKEKKKCGQLYDDGEKIYDVINKTVIEKGDFINRTSTGKLLTINSTKSVAQTIKKELNKELHYHWFRHTYATMCAINNIDENMLCEMMGHDKLETTRKYYLDTKNKQLVDRTKILLNKIFVEPAEMDIQTAIIQESLDKKLEHIPQEAIIEDTAVEDAADVINKMHGGAFSLTRIIMKKFVVRDERQLLIIFFEDGSQTEIDVTDVEEI